MKGYYICYSTKSNFVGVEKKVDNQIKVFNEYSDCEKIIVKREKTNVIKSIMWRLPFGSFGRDYKGALDKIVNPDYLYIRFVQTDRKYIKFIERLRIEHPQCKIIMEVPTYPYGNELLKNKTMFPFYFKDKIYNKRLKRYVDRIATLDDYEKIFGIQTIKTINGIDVNSVQIISPEEHNENEIHLIAVAMFQPYHGYERLINGLFEYYEKSCQNKRKIILHMVGDGPEKDKYVKLVDKLKLNDVIIFYGNKTGQDLDDLYNKSDIAVSSLGLYKLGINNLSALKTREYLAKGLPMVTGCNVDVLTKEFPYYIEFDNNSSVISIEKIIAFYDRIHGSNSDRSIVIDDIRRFAEETVDMRKVMQPIVEYIKSDK